MLFQSLTLRLSEIARILRRIIYMRLPQRLRMISFIVLSLATLLVVACASEKETVTVVQTVVSEKVVEVEKVVVATATTTAEELSLIHISEPTRPY